MSALLNPFFWFAVALAVWAVWRILRWISSGGRLPLRRRRGSASGMDSAGFSAQTFYNPSAEHLAETKREEKIRREEDDEGAGRD